MQMVKRARHPGRIRVSVAFAVISFSILTSAAFAKRPFEPEDLFRIRQIGTVEWSNDGRYAALEISKSESTLDSAVPTNDLALLDVREHKMRILRATAPPYIGFFNPLWSPDNRHLAYLSVDVNAFVQLWIWTVGRRDATAVAKIDVRTGFNDPPFAWIGSARLAIMAWDVGAKKSGDLYFRILRGRNAADGWKRAIKANSPSVSVLESGLVSAPRRPSFRLVIYDTATNTQRTIARGRLHRLSVLSNGRFISFFSEQPGMRLAPLFEAGRSAEDGYAAVNRGTERRVIDLQSGQEAPASSVPPQPPSPAKHLPVTPGPSPNGRRLSQPATADAALYLAESTVGTQLWLCGGGNRQMASCSEIWSANEWVRDIRPGRSRAISYHATDGTQLTGWILLPPDYTAGTRIPLITIVYPGSVYTEKQPPSFSLLRKDFEHPQLFAARGYAVLLPSMPTPKDPAQSHAPGPLSAGVLPAIDAAIASGIADRDRMAVVGQSEGGFATLGLITQTNRFRSAIASAGFSDQISLYGTFYGQYRYGDAGPPEKGQELRMLQMEKGVSGLGGPPWLLPDKYLRESPVMRADKVETPLMLIHGDLDFIPIQQDEEFFTALLRQDKRSMFVRYQGEWHTIANRANVLDLWRRIPAWLEETLTSAVAASSRQHPIAEPARDAPHQ